MNKWQDRFLDLAKHVAQWSKDPSTKCGAIIVEPETRKVIGIGYNGFPRGVRDYQERYDNREIKYKFIVHAERNAIYNANQSVDGCDLYIWPFGPCSECVKTIIQSGIGKIIHPTNEEKEARWYDSRAAGDQMLLEAGVVVVNVRINNETPSNEDVEEHGCSQCGESCSPRDA